jgi:hypothetical protein
MEDRRVEEVMAKRTPRSPSEDAPKTSAEAPRKRRRATPTPAPREVASDMAAEAPSTESTSMSSEPSSEDIRMRAYHRYLERGGGHGLDFEDWLEAERELKTRR